MLAAALTGLLVINVRSYIGLTTLRPKTHTSFKVSAELAALRPDVRGPGTFGRALLDEVSKLDVDTLLSRAKFEVVRIGTRGDL